MDLEKNFVGVKWKPLFVCCTMIFSVVTHTQIVIADGHEFQNKITHAKRQLTNFYHNFKEEAAFKKNPESQYQEDASSVFFGITALDEQLSQLDSYLKTLLFTNKEITISPTVSIISEAMEVSNGDIFSLYINQIDIAGTIERLHSKLLPIQEEINFHSHILKYNRSDYNKHLVIMGDVHIQQARINSLVSINVNNGNFDPSAFLKTNNSLLQRLSKVKVKVLNANWLLLEYVGNSRLKDLFIDNWNISVPVYTSIFESRNLQINNDSMINNIAVKDLMQKNVTKFSKGDVPNTILQVSSGKEREQGNATLLLQHLTQVENLTVDTINSIPVNGLFTSLFLKRKRNEIEGNLHFKNGLRTDKLVGKNKIHQHSVQNNTHQPSNGTVRPQWTAADQNRQLSPNVNFIRRRRRNEYEQPKEKPIRKINAKVKIIGNLRVKHLTFQNSCLQINNFSVPTSNIDEVFWTYNSAQVIHNQINFTQGVSLLQGSKHLTINGIDVFNYATIKTLKQVLFENVHVDGDVFLQNNPTSLNEMEVKHLHINQINGRNLQHVVRSDHHLFNQSKVVAINMSVRRDLEAEHINGINVRKQFPRTVVIDEDVGLQNAAFEVLSAKHAQVESINGLSLGLLLGFTGSQENFSVHLRGNHHIAKLANVLSVNNKTANLSLVVNQSNQNTIKGKKKFFGQTVCTDNVTIINIQAVNAEHTFRSLLRLSAPQLITGLYSIKKANIDSLYGVKEINGIDISRLIYTNQDNINIKGDINFKRVLVEGNVTGIRLFHDCTLPKVGQNMLFGSRRKWRTLCVERDCKWEQHVPSGSRIQHLLISAVTVDSNQTISGNIDITHLLGKALHVQSMNDKDITFIFQDSLYRNKTEQVFTGTKSFLGSIICKSVEVSGDARCTSINNIDINDIDRKLVRHKVNDGSSYRPTPILGHKRFIHGFNSFVLTCTEGINSIPSSSLVRESNHKMLPPLIIQSIIVSKNILVKFINGTIIEKFLEDCIYVKSAKSQFISHGLHITGNVILQGNVTTPTINNISIWDLVYITTEKYQIQIKGCQTFMSNIKIDTNTSVISLNNRNLRQKYKDNLKIYNNATINGSLEILPEVEVETIYAQEYFVHNKRLLKLKKATFP